jgi:hypothetical protein
MTKQTPFSEDLRGASTRPSSARVRILDEHEQSLVRFGVRGIGWFPPPQSSCNGVDPVGAELAETSILQ